MTTEMLVQRIVSRRFLLFCLKYNVLLSGPRMEYEERNRKKEAKEIAVLEVLEKMKETENQ